VQPVDLVIAEIAWLITMDASRRVIRDAAIVVDGGKIVAVGKSADIAERYFGKHRVDGSATVATPGFIDCHLHSSFQLSRGLADESNAQSFLFDRMYPYEAALEAEDVRVSAGGHLTKVDEAKLFAEVPVAVSRFRKHLKFENMVQLKWPVS
jgi:cytosine/adenosine deaminase-related metal-dependent hydrolase